MEKIKINSINYTNNLFIIKDITNNLFTGKIIKGSVNFKVFNEDNQEVNIGNIEEGDVVKIYTVKNKTFDLKEQKNSIIKKIIIKNKYVFNSDTSDDCEVSYENYFN
jgi:hypothetical protein